MSEEIIIPGEQIIRGLKAKLEYESCVCTPIDKCECDIVMKDIQAANSWIQSLPGNKSSCDG